MTMDTKNNGTINLGSGFLNSRRKSRTTNKMMPRTSRIVLALGIVFLNLSRHQFEIGLQLRKIEPRRKTRLLRIRRQNPIGFIDALVPPRPGSLLRITPGEDRDAGLVIGDRVDRMPVVGQFARSPWLLRLEFLLSIGLHLEAQIHAAEELNRQLDMRMILRLDTDKREDLLEVDTRT